MENYLILIIAVLTFVPIVLGILLGLLRGSRRSLLRLILIVLCVVLAFVLCGPLSKSVLNAEVTQHVGDEEVEEVVTLQEYLENMLGEDMKDLSVYVVPLVQSIAKVMLFLMLFLVFQLLSWAIVYPLCKLFVKPKRVKDSSGHTRRKKRRLLGAAIGLVQGVVVALCLCVIVNGFFAAANELTQISAGMAEMTDGTEEQQPELAMQAEAEDGTEDGTENALVDLKPMFEEYDQSVFGKLYNSIGSKPFTLISKVTTEDGKTVTLTGQLEAFHGLVDIGKEFIKLTDLNYNNLYADNNLQKLTDILNNVESIKEGLSEEAGDTVEGMLTILGDKMGIDMKKFYNINFSEEAAAFKKLSEYKDKDFSSMSPEEVKAAAKDLVGDLSKSELLLDLLADQDIDIGNGLDDAQRDEVDSTLQEMVQSGELDDATANRMRDIFGFNNNSGENNSDE